MPITSEDFQKADVSKIHSEINQILNQRYNLIAVTITIFGFFLAALTQKDKYKLELPYVSNVFIIAFCVLIILLTLNYFTRILTRQFYILRTYLIVKGYSEWESDYVLFRKPENKNGMSRSPYGYSKSQKFLYLLLGLLIIAISFVDQFLGQEFEPMSPGNLIGPGIYVLVAGFYYLTIGWITEKLLKNFDDQKFIIRWQKILGKGNNQSDESNDKSRSVAT
ncbi:MAG: hypothetical protein ABL895_16765 [Cyclobacteriaceae bacterium]